MSAVGRTAGAVGDLADSGVVVGMARGRAWIIVVGLLLGGIVAVNVLGLSLSASSSDTAMKVDELQRQNSVLEGRAANRLSNDKVSAVANRLGLAVPAAGDVGYLSAARGDIAEAARRLAAGEIAVGAAAVPDPVLEETALAVDPLAGEAVPADPVVAETPTESVPTETAPVEPVEPVEPAAPIEAGPATEASPATAGGLEAGGVGP